MAQSDRQGTGRHPHKDTEEPWPHTKDDRGEGEHRSRSSHQAQSGGSERSSHSSRAGESHSSSHGSQRAEGSRSEQHGSSDTDLKQREYRDEKGETHHHTRTYMEQHKGERNK
jgi:hypothetical protein